ncbi:cell division protein FtsQ/DivIB [Nocardiopsis coralliicola]
MAVADAEQEAPRSERRRSDPWKAAFVVLLVGALLALAAYLLLGSRLLVVRSVEVSGLDRIDRAAVVEAASVRTGTPLARVDTDAAADRVSRLQLAESVQVERAWPATLHIAVTEREPLLAVGAGDGYRLVDADGVRIDDTDTVPKNRPLAAVTGAVEGNPQIAAAAAVAEELSGALPVRAERIDARDTSAIRIDLAGGSQVQWGDTEQGARKARVLEVLLKEHPPEPDRVYTVSAPDMAVVD